VPNIMSAVPPKADMFGPARDVRFGPIADIAQMEFGLNFVCSAKAPIIVLAVSASALGSKAPRKR